MDFEVWEGYYQQILSEFGFKREEDERTAFLLSQLLIKKDLASLDEMRKLIQGKNVIVVGGGKNLEEGLSKEVARNIVIAADGTTSILLDKGLIPDVIVTDLDGIIEDQISANRMGATAAIHAHGDNMPQIEKWTPKFQGRIIGTVQCRPFDNLHNFGGFTDGDRGVFLAKHFGAKSIQLLGFDFENVGEKPNCDREIKLKKLKWAKHLIEILGVLEDEQISSLNSQP